MHCPRRIALVLCLACAGFTSALAQGDGMQIHDALQRQLEQAGPDEQVRAYLAMDELLDYEAMIAGASSLTGSERRARVVENLRNHAARTQARVLEYLEAGEQDGRVGRLAVVWACNSIHFSATRAVIEGLRAFDEIHYVNWDRPLSVEEMRDVGPLPPPTPVPATSAPYPFYEDFEGVVFGEDYWERTKIGTARVRVTDLHGPAAGLQHLIMESKVDVSDSVGYATLTIDLSAAVNPLLTFEFKEFGDEDDPEDGVFISEDGITWHLAKALVGYSNTYSTIYVDIDEAAAAAGILLNAAFKIRLSWADNYSIPTDGFAFDELRVDEGDPPPAVPTDNIIGLQAPQLWAIGIDGTGAILANLDSGVAYTHPDLAGQIWNNPNEIPGNGIDDDLNGYVDDTIGWDFENNDADPFPDGSFHGTNTAGIVVGDGTQGFITGMAPEARMICCKIGTEADHREAMQYAITMGAHAITSSYSFKWSFSPKPDYHLHRAVGVALRAAGVIHANSIGNQGDDRSGHPIPFNISSPGLSPGPWVHPEQPHIVAQGDRTSIHGCGAIYLDDSQPSYSGEGPVAWEDIRLYDGSYPWSQDTTYWDYPWLGGNPGLIKPDVVTYTNVKTTGGTSGYIDGFGGTSAATPHLGGTFCLMHAANPVALPRQISEAVQITAVDLGPPGKDVDYGAGKVQVYDAAMRLAHSVTLSDTTPSVGSSQTLTIHGYAPGNGYLTLLSATRSAIGGIIELRPPFVIVSSGLVPAGNDVVLNVTVPNDPGLIDLTVYLQSIEDDRKGATKQWLSSLVEVVTIDP